MYILRVEFNDGSGRASRTSVHPSEESARASLHEYARSNLSLIEDGESEEVPFDDPSATSDDLIGLYFEHADRESYSLEWLQIVGSDPFETIRSLHVLVHAFVQERVESIESDPMYQVVERDSETVDALQEDMRDRIEHVRWFASTADSLLAQHGIEG